LLSPFKIENVIWFWHDIQEFVYEIIQRKNGRSTEKVEEPNGIPQTLPESVCSFCASKKPKLLTQQTSPMLSESKPENCGDVIEVDQTAPQSWLGKSGQRDKWSFC
jgi:hypothetical protein